MPPRRRLERRLLRELRATLGGETFAAAWAKGAALSLDAAYALALTALGETAGAGTRVT